MGGSYDVSDVAVVTKLSQNSLGVRLAVSLTDDLASPTFSAPVDTVDRIAKLSVTGLAPATDYFCGIEVNGTVLTETIGKFRTKPIDSFRFAFATCNSTASNHAVFAAIAAQDPDFFLHLGDVHYENIATADISKWLDAYDRTLAAGPGNLFRQVSTHYIFDDHDYGPNDSDGTFTGRDKAVEAYRRRVPHPPLEEAGPDGAIYHSFEVGRCIFIMTDLRSESSPRGVTDNSSKTMMGATQKAWFKDILDDPANFDKVFFWCSSRVWTANTISGHDSWGGFTTERREIADHIKANCLGRIIILTGDRHQLGIDDGSNSDYATGGGGPVPVFMAAPLDRSNNSHGSGTFSEGVFGGQGQYGIVEVTDPGGDEITVDLTGMNSSGTELVTYQIVIDLS